jgi:uncharacterized Zn finger protein (UPF0148 family)
MSDFDKEAERERLREKYERDQEKRKSTERMSELLLKGATMTDAHCADCGDPIFRYDGEEFCPTCQEVITDDESGDAEGESDTADAETPGEAGTDASPASDTDASPAPGAGTTPESAPGANGANAGATGPRPDAPASNDPREDASTGRATRDRSTATASGDAEGLAAARDSLTRTLLAQARAAEACEDPRQAKTHLAAAREAAETISALSSY